MAMALVIGGFVVVANFVALWESFEGWNATAAHVRARVEAAGALIAAGVPTAETGRMEVWQTRGLHVSEVRRYVSDGWSPHLPVDEDVVSEVLGYITFRFNSANSSDLDLCEKIIAGSSLTFEADPKEPRFALSGDEVPIEVLWDGVDHKAVRHLGVGKRSTIWYPPFGPAILTIAVGDSGDVRVCSPVLHRRIADGSRRRFPGRPPPDTNRLIRHPVALVARGGSPPSMVS